MRPRGAFPSPRHRLAGAIPHRIVGATPSQFLWKPARLSMWLNDVDGDCVTAEEAFAKACYSPEIFITDATVKTWASKNGVLNGANLWQVLNLMQSGGFPQDGLIYDDGPFTSVEWTDAAIVQNAITHGPVKLGVAGDQLESVVPQSVANGWIATHFTPDPNEDHCISLCGYGTMESLSKQLAGHVPEGVKWSEPAYAIFTWSSIGIIDVPSLLAITGEAWLRNPTSVVVNI